MSEIQQNGISEEIVETADPEQLKRNRLAERLKIIGGKSEAQRKKLIERYGLPYDTPLEQAKLVDEDNIRGILSKNFDIDSNAPMSDLL